MNKKDAKEYMRKLQNEEDSFLKAVEGFPPEKPETCRKLQALRAVYGYLHVDKFTSEDLAACKHIIKEVLNEQ